MKWHLSEKRKAPSIHSINSNIPKPFSNWLTHFMNKDTAGRFKSADEALKSLYKIVGSQDIVPFQKPEANNKGKEWKIFKPNWSKIKKNILKLNRFKIKKPLVLTFSSIIIIMIIINLLLNTKTSEIEQSPAVNVITEESQVVENNVVEATPVNITPITFEKTYGEICLQSKSTVLQTQDKGYLLVSKSKYDIEDNYCFSANTYISKMDSVGSLQWEWQKDIFDRSGPKGAIRLGLGQYLIYSYEDGFMIIDKLGDIKRSVKIRESVNIVSMIQEDNGDLVFVGSKYNKNEKINQILLCKYDINGNEIWSKIHDYYDNCRINMIICNPDNNYTIIGNSDYNYECYIIIIQVNENGNLLWHRELLPGANPQMIRTDIGYTFLSYINQNSYYIQMTQTDFEGNINWNRNIVRIKSYWYDGAALKFEQTNDKGYIIVSSSQNPDNTVQGELLDDILLIKTDSLGNIEWKKTFGGKHDDFGHSVQQTQDGGYIISGRYRYPGSSLPNLYLIKTDSLGNVYNEHEYIE